MLWELDVLRLTNTALPAEHSARCCTVVAGEMAGAALQQEPADYGPGRQAEPGPGNSCRTTQEAAVAGSTRPALLTASTAPHAGAVTLAFSCFS